MLTVAIIGRPNVGKSTLFNRLVGKKLALVHDLPGVTRDRKMAEANFRDLRFQVIDTAGYEYSTTDNMESRMWKQTQMAIADADLCLFLFDARAGLQPYDEQFADLVRKTHKPVLLLANKCEGKQQENAIGEAYKLGLGEPVAFSAEHGIGFEDLYTVLLKAISEKEAQEEQEEAEKNKSDKPIQIAFVGRPNVGKS
ncbi:MAG: 50S ribosome-binding GTPase, partial [Alphaproteobacteria bacterium]|nr:50S ribosome-binding GTPase [Alphaproteobacteria bacterium]